VAEEQALLDSGASENLIDEETWKTLGIGHSNYPNQSPSTMWMERKTSKEKSLNTVGSKSRRGTKNTECDSSLLA